MPTFDGESLVVTLDSGVTSVDCQDDLYEEWKDWMLLSSTNRGYPPLFDIVRSEELVAATGLNSGAYFFLRNDLGWRIKPPEEDISVYLTGNLLPKDSTLPILTATDGGYTTGVFGIQPVTQVIPTESGDFTAVISGLSQIRNLILAGV